MWVKVGGSFLNLDRIVAVHFLRDDDGKLTANVETVAGHTKHYTGLEAEALKQDLDALAAGPPPVE